MLLTELPALYFLPFAVKSLLEPALFALTGFISPRFKCATNISWCQGSATNRSRHGRSLRPASGDSEGASNPAGFAFTLKDSKTLQEQQK